jgi:hypothetical protein
MNAPLPPWPGLGDVLTPDAFWNSAVGRIPRVQRAVEFNENCLTAEEREIVRRRQQQGDEW